MINSWNDVWVIVMCALLGVVLTQVPYWTTRWYLARKRRNKK